MIKAKIQGQIKKVLENLQTQGKLQKFEIPEVTLETPPPHIKADFSSNIAFSLAKPLKRTPQELANLLQKEFAQKLKNIFQKIEIAGKGFLNFSLKQGFLHQILKEVLAKEDFGKINLSQGKKAHIDFISINPTGKLHIGHGRGAFFGDALGNVLEAAGWQVHREYFVNNAKVSTQIRELGKTVLGTGRQYQSEYLKALVKSLENSGQLTPALLQKGEEEVGFFVAQRIMEDLKEFIEKKLKIHFDMFYEEQAELYEKGKIEKTLEVLKQKNLTYIKQGALWLESSGFGDEKDRVLIRKDGRAGYFLPDIAYHQDKVERGFDLIIDVWGADHQGHKKRMEAVAKIFGYEKKLKILIHQMVSLKTKQGLSKLSKRAGTAVDLEWLVDKVGLDVTRFLMLSKALDTQMVFDLEQALEKSLKNPVFYVQYAAVRCQSILNKATRDMRQETRNKRHATSKIDFGLLKEKEELCLIKKIAELPDLVAEISQNFQVHQLTTYLMDLATLFHNFYEKHRVITQDKALTQARLSLVQAVHLTVNKGLSLLGISIPQKM